MISVDIEVVGEQPKEPLAVTGIERQIGAAEIGGAGARGDLTAATVEAAQHLLADAIGIVSRGVGLRGPGQYPARRLGDITTSASEVSQCPIENAFKKAGGSGIGHGALGSLSRLGRDARTHLPSIPKNG